MCIRKAARCISLLLIIAPVAFGAVTHLLAGAPAGWRAAASQPSSDTVATFTLALKMQNMDRLESMLLAVATPGKATYGQYMDLDDVQSTFGPSADAVSSVTAWLRGAGIINYRVDGAFVDFAADLATINSLFNASYKHYTSDSTSDSTTKLRTTSYTIPDELASYITLVDPGVYFSSTATMQSFAPSSHDRLPIRSPAANAKLEPADSCERSLTPMCLKQMYNVGNYTAKLSSGSKIGFGSFLNQSAIVADALLYETTFDIPMQNFSVELISGGIDNQSASIQYSVEANLDVQTIIGVSHPLPVAEFITGGFPPFIPNIEQLTNDNEPYLPYYRYLLSKPNSDLPQVISNSYGENEDSVPLAYAQLACNLIGLMGLRGITILESSGDLGVGAGCRAPDNKTVEFTPIFPATCPYLTSVGGTVELAPESAWSSSSGGFSRYFERPAYQDATIARYMKTVSNETYAYYTPYTNWAGRGFPDVAAHSTGPSFATVYAGTLSSNGGTSASAPVWAAVVGLLNDARLRLGKPALGWLNPLVYTYGSRVLTDITTGYSTGCNRVNNTHFGGPPGIVPGARWNATEGWDPVTGYGTPDFEKLKALVLSL